MSDAILGLVAGAGAFVATAVIVVGAAWNMPSWVGAGLAVAYLCVAAAGIFAGWASGRLAHRSGGFAISFLLSYGLLLLLGDWLVNGITDAAEPPPFVPDFRPLIALLAAYGVTYMLVRRGQGGDASGAPP